MSEAEDAPLSPLLRASRGRHRALLPWLFALSTFGWTASYVHEQRLYSPLRWAVYAAIGGPVVFVAAYARKSRTLVSGLVAGAAAAAFYAIALSGAGQTPGWYECVGASAFGTTAYVAFLALGKPRAERSSARDVLVASLVITLLTPASLGVLFETTSFLPRTWDGAVYAMDATLPFHAFHVGRLLEAAPPIRFLAALTYDGIFVALPLLYGLQIRRKDPVATDLLTVVVGVSLLGQIGYYVTPVIGPAFAFPHAFPGALPDVATVSLGALPAPPDLRNCMPSVHTALALVLLWNTRGFSLVVRAIGVFVLAFTVLSTLGFGYHYVFDLVAAVPFAAAVQVGCTRVSAADARLRQRALAAEAALALVGVASPRFVSRSVLTVPALLAAYGLFVVVCAVLAERAVAKRALPLIASGSDVPAARAGYGVRDAALGFAFSLVLFPVFRSLEVAFGEGSSIPFVASVAGSIFVVAALFLLRRNRAAAGVLAAPATLQFGLTVAAFAIAFVTPRAPSIYRAIAIGAEPSSLRALSAVAIVSMSVATPVALALTLFFLGVSLRVAVPGGTSEVAGGAALGLCASAYWLCPVLGLSASTIAGAAVFLVLLLVSVLERMRRRVGEVVSPGPSFASVPADQIRALCSSRDVSLALGVAAPFVVRSALARGLAPCFVGSPNALLFDWAPLVAAVAIGAAAARGVAEVRGPDETHGIEAVRDVGTEPSPGFARAAADASNPALAVDIFALCIVAIALPIATVRAPRYVAEVVASGVAPRLSDHEWLRSVLAMGLGVPFAAIVVGAFLARLPSFRIPLAVIPGVAIIVGAMAGELVARILAAAGVASLAASVALLCALSSLGLRRARGATLVAGLGAAGVAALLGIASMHVAKTVVGPTAGAHSPNEGSARRAHSDDSNAPGALFIDGGSDSVPETESGDDVTASPREFLLRSTRRWSSIHVGPTSPASAGAALFSRDFMELVREHLEPGGVFDEALVVAALRPSDLETAAATTRDAFRAVWLDSSDGLLTIFATDSSSAKSGGASLLAPSDADAWLRAAAGKSGDFSALVSNDDNLLVNQAAFGGVVTRDFPNSLLAGLRTYETRPPAAVREESGPQ